MRPIRWVERRLEGRDRQSGMTVIELSVSMVITGILLASVATVTVATLGAVRENNSRSTTAADGRIGLETITRTLRAATVPSGENAAITVATSKSVTFYAQLNRANALDFNNTKVPNKIEYYLSGNCLWEAQTPARVISASNGSTSFAWDTGRTAKCVLRTFDDPTLPALFRYYDTPTTTTSLPAPLTTSVALQSVRSVSIDLSVIDPNNNGFKGFPMKARVTLNNVVLLAGGSV